MKMANFINALLTTSASLLVLLQPPVLKALILIEVLLLATRVLEAMHV